MPARKKDDALAGFTVVLEDIRSQFKVFGESLQGLREHMDARFDAVDRRFEATDDEIALVKAAVLENNRDLKDLRGVVGRKVDRDEVEAIVGRALAR